MSFLHFDCEFRYSRAFELRLAFDAEQQVTALVGPSGCGKTTVLNLIAGLLRPLRGTISIRDRLLFDSAKSVHSPPEERAVGYVFQDYQLFPHLTVEQNLRFGLRRSRAPRIAADDVIGVLRLADFLKRYPVELSGGQKQRVALGRAILQSPQLLLLDEPWSAIDVAHRQAVVQFVSECIREFGIPALLVSHDPESIEQFADAVVRMPCVHVETSDSNGEPAPA